MASISVRRPFRKTRDSVVLGDFAPPYTVERFVCHNSMLLHATARCEGAAFVITCCKARLNPPNPSNVRVLGTAPTCLLCVLCKGCPACIDDYVREETMRLGKWETKDGRALYPFEMDDTHLTNAIKKLKRDQSHFKEDWKAWLEILDVEAAQRGLV